MAMIHCPYCNEKISSTAKRCLYCEKSLTAEDVSKGVSDANEEVKKKIEEKAFAKQQVESIKYAQEKEKSVSNLFYSWMESSPKNAKKNRPPKKLNSFMWGLVGFGWTVAMIVPLIMAGATETAQLQRLARIGLIISVVVSVIFLAYFSRFTFVPLYNVRKMVEDVKIRKINVNSAIKALIDPFRSDTDDQEIKKSIIPSFFTAMCLLNGKSKRALIIDMVFNNILLLCIAVCMTAFCYGMAFIVEKGWNLTCTLSLIGIGVVLIGKILGEFIFGEIYKIKITDFLKAEYPVEYNIGL